MTDRFVEPCSLGQQRVNHDETCGVWRRPSEAWVPDTRFFLCLGCGFVIPESASSDREGAFLDERRGRCDRCEGRETRC